MKTRIPGSLKAEHHQLIKQFARATEEPGLLGREAREILNLLHAHFAKEERYAIPPLALLPKLAWGALSADMAEILPVTRRLKAELPLMLLEHKNISAALRRFLAEAQERGRSDYEDCAMALLLHAAQEEEVSYPAAVLVGEYLELKLQLAKENEADLSAV